MAIGFMRNNKKEINIDSIISRNNEIDDAELDGEKVMMNLDKGQYFMLNEVGSRIWEIIESPIKVKDITSTLLGEYEIDEATCSEAVNTFLNKLMAAELIDVK